MRSTRPVGIRCALVDGDSAHPFAWGGQLQIAKIRIKGVGIGQTGSRHALRPS